MIDTVAQNMQGDEDIKNFNLLVREAGFLRNRYHSEIILIHHAGKDIARGSRGGSNLPAGCDTIIELTGSMEKGIKVKCMKQKNSALFPDYELRPKLIDLGMDEDGEAIDSG